MSASARSLEARPGAVCRHELLLVAARATKGFMPDDEGLALTRLCRLVASAGHKTVVELGAYCGRSTLYLAAGIAQAEEDARAAAAAPAAAPLATEPSAAAPSAAAPPAGAELSVPPETRCVLFSVDHHHGSEENQAGWEHHDPSLVDMRTGRLETLPSWRAAVDGAGAGDLVVGVVGESSLVASHWNTPAGLVFIDGGHGEQPAWADYLGWVPHIAEGGYLAIHDVFPDPAEGGRPPYELYVRALGSGAFCEMQTLSRRSLRVLRRMAPGL
jgi:predicted O-methyltransferase YrrM